MVNKNSFQQSMQKIEQLVSNIERSADPNLRANALALMKVLMDLHGAGLEKMLSLVFQSGPSGQAIIDNFANDQLISSLLLLYGLHPETLHTRLLNTIAKLNDHLQSYGGNLMLSSINEDGAVRLHLSGTLHNSVSIKALQKSVEDAIYEVAPDISSLTIEVSASSAPVLVQLQRANNGALSAIKSRGE